MLSQIFLVKYSSTMNKRETGSYYTSLLLTEFIHKRINHIFSKRKSIDVLEPSVGDGAFVEQINKYKCQVKLTAIDISDEELRKAKKRNTNKYSRFKCMDFLNYKSKKKFDLVIGNPPFIKKNILSKEQLHLANEIHERYNFSKKSFKNIWITFLIKSIFTLKNDGILAFVLPSDFLQLNFPTELREYIVSHFERTEIYTFNELLFDCKGQETIVLICYGKHNLPGLFIKNVSNLKEEKFCDINDHSKVDLLKSKFKWTHHYLTSDELNLLENIRNKTNKIEEFTKSKPGIVTAANSYFILSEAEAKRRNIEEYTIPIIQKGVHVNGKVHFTKDDLNKIEKDNIPSRLLRINSKMDISNSLKKYLKLGRELKIDQRYKCKKRSNWYEIPNITKKPEAFFFKRSHLYPKLLANETDALLTDSAYYIEMLQKSRESLIFSFYNTMTLMFAELDGRFYGGGVLELTPNEFKKLPIHIVNTSKFDFKRFAKKFKSKKNIEEILRENDILILRKSLGLSNHNIKKITNIRKRLIGRRIRNQ